MAGFLYFIEIGSNMAPAVLERLGGNHTHKQDVVGQTPGEKAGAVFGQASYRDEKQLHKIKYLPAQQTWNKLPGMECWVGYYNDDPPVPADLKKPKQLDGHDVDIHGHTWKIPYTRNGDGLPRKMRLGEDGEWEMGDVVKEHETVFQASVKYWDFLFAGEDSELTHREAADICTTMIMGNYFVSAFEISLLELIDTETVHEILSAIVDYPQLEKLIQASLAEQDAKKNDSQPLESSSSNDGNGVSTQTLIPA